MITFLTTAKTVTVAHCPASTLVQLRAYLKVGVANRFFAMRRARGNWDGTVAFLSAKNTFSWGLWRQVKYWLEENQLEYEVKKVTPNLLPQLTKPTISPTLTLRDNQLTALNKWLQYDGFGICWCPPAWGKTELSAAAIATLKPKQALFLVNSRDLLLQAQERFKLRLPGTEPGLIGDGEWTPQRITVAMVQSLFNVLKKKDHPNHAKLKILLAQTDLIIQDEAHHGRSKQIRTVFNAANPRYCLGLSARPFHEYGRNLQAMTAEDAIILATLGPIVYRESTSELIDQGQLAKPHILLVPINHQLAEELAWSEARKRLYANPELTTTVTTLTKAAADAGQATLVITGSSLTFNHQLCRALVTAGINATELNGALDKNTRADARLALNQDGLQAAVATTIFDEGIDIPNLRQLILAYGGKSLIKVDQRTGRSLRQKHQGANTAVIVEFMSYGNHHLYKHSITRLKRYIEESAYELYLVRPSEHSNYVRRLLKDKARPLDALPTTDYYRQLAQKA